MDILAGLNPAQKEAVEAVEGPLLILAGPGSGKTRVIAHRVAYLVKVWGIRPHRIMAVTFTNKAAGEMRERLAQLLGEAVSNLTLGTFHAICARILRQEGKAFGLDRGFVIYDADDQLSLIKRSLQDVGLDPRQYSPRAILSAISAAKSRLLRVGDFAQQSSSYFDEVVHRVYERYQELLTQSQALDFDDLLMRTVYLFRDHPEVLSKYQSRYLHLLIDEFQDTNIAQYALARELAGKYRNICVVGDPDQSIYSWRSADLRNILSFEKDYPDARVVYLEQNYRSTQTILDAATEIIAQNRQRKPKNLWTDNEAGPPLTVVETYTEHEEAQFVASEVERLSERGLARAGDCAVMYRTNAQSRALEETFVRYGIPYKLVGATRFYDRREIRDVIAYLRLIHNPLDEVSLARIINVPGRGIGQRTLEEFSRWAQAQGVSLYRGLQTLKEKHDGGVPLTPRATQTLLGFITLMEELVAAGRELSLPDLFDLVLERTGYRDYVLADEDGEDRWDNILELRNVAQDYAAQEPEEALTSFLEGVALVSDVDDLDEKADRVTLITLHQAKGLEFEVVFITGMEEGVLPHIRSFDDPDQMEEERRLCYVGVTRAKKLLYLVRSFQRTLSGMGGPRLPSRFLEDIPRHLIATAATHEEDFRPVTPPPPDLPTLAAGDQVRHGAFGEGIVVGCLTVPGDQEVMVEFKGVGMKRLLLSLAKLEKVDEWLDAP
jgi:DNA helicase-2/ATP-dependent DNA helicase PcrA